MVELTITPDFQWDPKVHGSSAAGLLIGRCDDNMFCILGVRGFQVLDSFLLGFWVSGLRLSCPQKT